MKKLLLLLTLSAFCLSANAQIFSKDAETHRIWLAKPVNSIPRDTLNINEYLISFLDTTIYIKGNVFLAPVATVNAIKINKSGVSISALGGVGYGVHIKPKWCTLNCDALYSFNTFLNIGTDINSDLQFIGTISEVLSLFDNSISIGAMYDIGDKSWYMCIGYSTEIRW